MFDIEGLFDQQILSEFRNRPTVIFPEAMDPRILEAASYLVRFIRPVFLAPESKVRELATRQLSHVDANRLEFAFSESAFVDISERKDLIEEFAVAYQNHSREKGLEMEIEQARRFVVEPAHFGICAVRQGHADTVVGGASHESKDYFRPMLSMLTRDGFCCEAGVFVLPDDHQDDIFPHNIVVFGDVGVNATMTPDILAQVAVGTCSITRDLIPPEILPEIRGAVVSYSNRGSDEGPATDLVRKASELIPDILTDRISRGERYRSIKIQSEVKVSVALSRRSAMYYHQGEDSEWGGPTVIICPNLDMGNLLYHLHATRFPAAKKFCVLFGVDFQGVDLAMDTTPEDIRLSVKASVLRMHQYGKWKRTPHDTFFRRYRVLAINPGSTSTRISVYDGEEENFTSELQHSSEELLPFEGKSITAQFEFRKEAVLKALKMKGLTLADIDAVSARGGLLHPIPHGTYLVGSEMLTDLREGKRGEHACNLGGLIAHELVSGTAKPAYIVDPVVVDEVPNRVKISGIRDIRRKVISHALNQIATARRYAEEHETFYEKMNLIVGHMGGGISVGAHKKGHYIDVNNALDGEVPFSPQRSGTLPTGQLIDLCFSGKYTLAELKKLNKGRGGLIDLLGTADLQEVERRIANGDTHAAEVFEAMAYRLAREIASLIPAFEGERVDQILLTGGMARSSKFIERIRGLVAAIGCGVTVYPGENEMTALVKGALRVLNGKEMAREYTREDSAALL